MLLDLGLNLAHKILGMGLYLDLHPHLYLMLPRPLPLPPRPLALLLLALFQHHTPSATDISSACCWRIQTPFMMYISI